MRRGWMGNCYLSIREIQGITCLPERIFWMITTREMITRIYLHIYITYIIHYHGETRQTSGRGDCGGIVTTAVTVAVTSCDAVESECGVPYVQKNFVQNCPDLAQTLTPEVEFLSGPRHRLSGVLLRAAQGCRAGEARANPRHRARRTQSDHRKGRKI
jgi:hypothetical protein